MPAFLFWLWVTPGAWLLYYSIWPPLGWLGVLWGLYIAITVSTPDNEGRH